MSLYQYPQLYAVHLEDASALNQNLFDGFMNHIDDEDIRRSHYFDGRYENIYIGSDKIPEITTILEQVIHYASQILQRPENQLKAGLWFNAMGHGHTTTAHRHDDDDELLSAVYYVRIPENSGELILSDRNFATHVTPQEGMFAFFPPDMMHEVTENKSKDMRLSLGINIGPK